MFKTVQGSFKHAQQFFQENKFGAAELICRSILVNSGDSWSSALKMLSKLSEIAGFPLHAASYRSASFAETLEKAEKLLRYIHTPNNEAPFSTSQERFLIVLARGNGFWSDISHVLGCAVIAEVTHRELIIHWGDNSFYRNDLGTDCFRDFFRRPNRWNIEFDSDGAILVENDISTRRIAARDWHCIIDTFNILKSDKTVVVCKGYIGVPFAQCWQRPTFWPTLEEQASEWKRLSSTYLRLTPLISQNVGKFIANSFGNYPYAAVHIRGTDKIIEDENLYETNEKIISSMKELDIRYPIFLLTDDLRYASAAAEIFGSRIHISPAARTDSIYGVHRSDMPVERSNGVYPAVQNRNKLGLDIILDTFVAVRSKSFIGNGRSNVSGAISLIGNFDPNCLKIFNENQLTELIDWADLLT